jgi:hypothetical protein
VNTRQAANPRAPKDTQQYRLCLIVERVSCGNAAQAFPARQVTEKVVAQFARRRLHTRIRNGITLSRLSLVNRRIYGVKVQTVRPREFPDELFVLVRLGASQFVIYMRHRKHDAQVWSQLFEQAKERDRVGAPRNRYGDAVSGMQEVLLSNCSKQPGCQFVHGENGIADDAGTAETKINRRDAGFAEKSRRGAPGCTANLRNDRAGLLASQQRTLL